MRSGVLAAVLGAVAAAAPDVHAQAPGFHLNQAATACANPRAIAALGNAAEPRRADPSWVAFVVRDGRCTSIEAGASVSVIGQAGAVVQVEYPRGSGQHLFVAGVSLSPDALPAAGDALPAVADTTSADGWTTANAGSGVDAACGLSGPAGSGTLALSAAAGRPGIVRLVLSKPSWRVPPRTPVQVNAAFSGMPVLSLPGVGQGASLEFALGDAFKPWLHGFTAAASGTLTFPGATEPPWQLDLAGTSAAMSAMAECIRESGTIVAPPPLGSAVPAPAASDAPRQAVTAGAGPRPLEIELPPIRR